MTTIDKDIVILNEEDVLSKYIKKRHKLLLFLRDQHNLGNCTTVIEIIRKFCITKENAWKKLSRLKKVGDIKKGEKITVNGNVYFNFLITDKVRQELKVVSRNLYENHFPSIPTGKLDNIMENLAKNLKNRVEKIIREYLPEGKRCTELIQTLTDEIHDFFDEGFNSGI